MPVDWRKLIGEARPFSYATAVCAIALGLCLELFLSKLTGSDPSTTLFAVSTAVSAWFGGAGPGVLALILSATAIDYLVYGPGTFFHFANLGQLLLFVCYVLGWLGFCLLSERTYRLLRRDRNLRRMAEQTARQSDRVAQVTAALGQARTPGAVIEAAIQEPLHALEADGALVVLTKSDGETAEIVRMIGQQQDGPQPNTLVSLAQKSPIADAVGRGSAVIVESKDAHTSEYRGVDRALSATTYQAAVAVPLVIGSRVVAVVQLEFARAADVQHRRSKLSVRARSARGAGARSHVAIRIGAARACRGRNDAGARGRRTRDAPAHGNRAARERGAFPHARRADESSARSDRGAVRSGRPSMAVAQAVVRQGKIAAGATSGEVALLVDSGPAFEIVHSDVRRRAGIARRRIAAEIGFCATHVIETRQPVLHRVIR